MRILVTGASGWIGSASVKELLSAGHQVVGLARSDESAALIARLGAEVLRGSLDEKEVVRSERQEHADGQHPGRSFQVIQQQGVHQATADEDHPGAAQCHGTRTGVDQ